MEFRGELKDPGGRFAIAVSHWNDYVTDGLVSGALKTFEQHGISEDRIDRAWVPGSLELPLLAKKLAQSNRYRAILALGCVVKGETAHFEVVANESCRGLAQLSLECDIPILLGVLTTYTMDQAIARSGPDDNNKGSECALSAIRFLNLLDALETH